MENKNNELHITYLFDASTEQVFEAWTSPEILKNWYAPEGCSIDFKSIVVKVVG